MRERIFGGRIFQRGILGLGRIFCVFVIKAAVVVVVGVIGVILSCCVLGCS